VSLEESRPAERLLSGQPRMQSRALDHRQRELLDYFHLGFGDGRFEPPEV